MKKHIRTILFMTGIAIVLAIAGCSMLAVSIEDRISSFVDDLNNDRGNAYLNFAQGVTTNYNEIKPAAFWDTDFPAGTPAYSITDLDTTNPAAVTAQISGPTTPLFDAAEPLTITFKMTQVGFLGDWFIEELTLENHGLVVD